MRAPAALIIISSCVVAATTPASAQNLAPRPMGGRTGAMGGTGVAFGDDAAMAFLNPAGLARVPSHVLSLSLSAYELDVRRYDRFFARRDPPSFQGIFELEGNRLGSSTFSAYPSSLAYLMHLSDAPSQVLALSVLIPSAERRELDGTLRISHPFITANNGLSFVRDQTTYFVGPSYAIGFGSNGFGLTLGASAFLAYTTRTTSLETEDVSGTVPATDFQVMRGGLFSSGSSYDVVLAAGAQLRVGVVNIGVALHAPSLHVGGSYESTSRYSRFGNGGLDAPDVTEERKGSGSFREQTPLRATAGLAILAGALTVAADVGVAVTPGTFAQIDGSAQVSTLNEGAVPVNEEVPLSSDVERDTVVNGSIGVEYRLSETVCVRAGGFTDFSATSLDDLLRAGIATERIHRFGGTVGLGLDFGGAETALVVGYTGGIGQVVGFDVGNFDNPIQLREVDALESTFTAMLSGTVDLKSFLGGG